MKGMHPVRWSPLPIYGLGRTLIVEELTDGPALIHGMASYRCLVVGTVEQLRAASLWHPYLDCLINRTARQKNIHGAQDEKIFACRRKDGLYQLKIRVDAWDQLHWDSVRPRPQTEWITHTVH